MHVDKKTGLLKPNFSDHVFTAGFSVQRHERARIAELFEFVKGFLSRNEKAAWLGVVVAPVAKLRACRVSDVSGAAFCIYDSAEMLNPAHGEITATRYAIEDADRIEAQKHILDCFGSGRLVKRHNYKNGKIWGRLSEKFQQRSLGKIQVEGINS